MIGGPGAERVAGAAVAAVSAARHAATGRFDPATVDDVGVITRSLIGAVDESRRLDEAAVADAGHAPAMVPSMGGLPDGVPVLDPARDPAQMRDELAAYAPVLRVEEGALHVAGAPVHRDIARWLGHPIAEASWSDGTPDLVHVQRQVGASAGYGSLAEARFAAMQVLGGGPEGNPAVQGIAVLRSGGDGALQRWLLATSDQPLSRMREEGGFWGARDPIAERPVRVEALRYATESGDTVPAELLLGRDGTRRHLSTDSAREAPFQDAASLMPQARLDALSVVGHDPETLARRVEVEGWKRSLADRLGELGDDPALAARVASPQYAERLARAERVMADLRLDETSGWTPVQLEGFREALMTSGHDVATAEVAMARVAPWADNIFRVGYTRYDGGVRRDTDYGVWSEHLSSILGEPLSREGRAGLVAGALRSRSAGSSVDQQAVETSMAIDRLLVRSNFDTRGRFLLDLKDSRNDSRNHAAVALGGAVAGGRTVAEIDEIGRSVEASGLKGSVTVRMLGHVLGAQVPAEEALRVFRSALFSGNLDAAEANVVARLREAERAQEATT